jgi:two-component system, OmpR family, sensor histidine kinase SenX3
VRTVLGRHRLEETERARRRAESRAEVAEAEVARLRHVLEELAPTIVVSDENGHVVLRNRPSLDAAGSRPMAALVTAAVDELLAVAAGGAPASRTLDLHGPPSRVLQVSAAPLHHGGRQVGAVAVVDDISERRRLESVRRDFVANVSHELRTPVGALGVLAETLADEDDPETTRRLAARITAEAERAGRLVEDLLDLSRIEAGGADIGRPLRVDDIVAAAVERVRPVAALCGVDVVVADHAAVQQVQGDETQLLSAVTNLLDNAVKYSDRGSTVEVGLGAACGWVDITVRDCGIGIPSKDLERIFERFYRVDRARSRGTGGTGLGLSIVRHVADNHGGQVLVRSTEGEGSTFTLRLPTGGTT